MWAILLVIIAANNTPDHRNGPALATTQIGEYKTQETCQSVANSLARRFTINGQTALAYAQCVQIKDKTK